MGAVEYSGRSAMCVAAAHSGILPAEGGEFIIEIGEPLALYNGKTMNGIKSSMSFTPGEWSFQIKASGPSIEKVKIGMLMDLRVKGNWEEGIVMEVKALPDAPDLKEVLLLGSDMVLL